VKTRAKLSENESEAYKEKYMKKNDTVIRNVAMTNELYERIMEYSFKNKLYRFSTASIQLLNLALDSLEESK